MYEPDMITGLKDLNDKTDRCMYIMLVGQYMIANTVKSDVDKYLASESSVVSAEDMDDITLIYGVLLDPESLPYEIPEKAMKDQHLWLLIEEDFEIRHEVYADITHVILAIEDHIKKNEDLDIDNFAVLLGQELELALAVAAAGSYMNPKDIYND